VDDPADRFLPEWHRIVAERDVAALGAVLAPDVTLGAPPYWSRLAGRDLVQHLLGLVVHAIEGFTYHREWRDGRELALEFRGRVGEIELQGTDLITLDPEGRIQNLDVLMRPLNGIAALRDRIAPRMAEYLARRG
jgi:hypothetical protein